MIVAACGAPPPKAVRDDIQVVQERVRPPPVPAQGRCRSLQLQNIVGQRYAPTVASQARDASGATELLVLEPGQAVGPADPDRLTLELNGNDTIVAARCG